MKEIIQKCKKCGKDIERPDPRRLYCFKCSAIMQNEYKKAWILNNPDKVRNAKDNANRKKRERLTANPRMFTCIVCGKTFRRMGNKKHCSKKCRNVTRARRQKSTYIPNNGRNGSDIVCALCGKTITKNAYNQKYCDDCQKKMACHYERRRNLSKKNIDGTHTKNEFNDLCNRMNWKCAYCGKKLNIKTATEDHIIPLIHDGSDNISNIALACLSCNCSKNDSSVYDFIKRKQCSLGI